jgi:hypothetical protein
MALFNGDRLALSFSNEAAILSDANELTLNQ